MSSNSFQFFFLVYGVPNVKKGTIADQITELKIIEGDVDTQYPIASAVMTTLFGSIFVCRKFCRDQGFASPNIQAMNPTTVKN